MRRLNKKDILVIGISSSLFFGLTPKKSDVFIYEEPPIDLEMLYEIEKELDSLNGVKELNKFLHAVGIRESSNDYHVVNSYGYMGKYQFGKATLETIGYKVTRDEFLYNPELQEEAMIKLLKYNQERLHKYIELYDGSLFQGQIITESGILAAAHLAGDGNVKKFFKNGEDFLDGNGTKLTSYLTEFSGFDIKKGIEDRLLLVSK